MKWRKWVGGTVAVACTLAAAFLFDWRQIGAALRDVRLGLLVCSGTGLMIMASGLRGLRWLVMLGLPLTKESIALSSLANGAAAGLAAVTPLQIGEALKIRLGPEAGWQPSVAALIVERGMDLSAVTGVLLSGLAAYAGYAWAIPLLLLSPVVSGLLLILLSSPLQLLPQRAHVFLEISRHHRRILIASLLTVPVWLLNLGLWWCVATAIGVHLDFAATSVLLGGVVLASVASMAPAGLGISELGTRGIMMWLGFSVEEAEAMAIGLRLLLSPLIVVFGLACITPLKLSRKSSG